eukprot:4650253-Prymnesium_polylepis.1
MAIKRDPAVKRALGETAIFGEAHPESFPPCRIVSDASISTTTKAGMYMAIVSYIFSQPPFELGWLRNYADRTDELFPFLVEPRVSLADLPSDIPADHRTTFLALRGFLACGVLLHVLSKRYDVEYGINPAGKKRLAVPFRANQTPAERAEYGHPDCAIALTTLAYHYRGLSLQQFTNALKVLLAYEDAAQNYFRDWVELSLPRMKQSGADWESVQRVDQIDPQNHTQAKLLYEYFRFNELAINFWLNHCVFPQESMQHPQKLVANAWHLVANPRYVHSELDGCDDAHGATAATVHGFSGTNDNHRMLPLQVDYCCTCAKLCPC